MALFYRTIRIKFLKGITFSNTGHLMGVDVCEWEEKDNINVWSLGKTLEILSGWMTNKPITIPDIQEPVVYFSKKACEAYLTRFIREVVGYNLSYHSYNVVEETFFVKDVKQVKIY